MYWESVLTVLVRVAISELMSFFMMADIMVRWFAARMASPSPILS